jgi:D-alanyl-D-alanine carboxypeptidase/D-alanyl-D-alanine-endopeptidase (penicillin-binding protein 4)
LYTIRSEPLARLVMDLNKFSNNVMAESILKTMGAVEYGTPGTTTKGLAVVARFLNEDLDAPLNSYIMADGSGLSDLNRFSPHQVVDLLIHAYSDFHIGPEFVASLKLGGVDGWNPRPFRDPPLVGEMRLKSGHIRGVNTLSGYAHTESGRVVAFCVLINDHRSQQWEIDQRMAEISQVLLASY